MNIKIFKYVNGKFVWWWTKHPSKTGKFFGYKKTKYTIDSDNFGVDPTIENFLSGKVSLMAMIQKSTI
jgi:hypothetical protein